MRPDRRQGRGCWSAWGGDVGPVWGACEAGEGEGPPSKVPGAIVACGQGGHPLSLSACLLTALWLWLCYLAVSLRAVKMAKFRSEKK